MPGARAGDALTYMLQYDRIHLKTVVMHQLMIFAFNNCIGICNLFSIFLFYC